VKCKFYFNNEIGLNTELQNGKIMMHERNMKMSELDVSKKYTEVSFMIFRTGSCLIVGNCSERILMFIFDFIKNILKNEYAVICVASEEPLIKIKKSKLRKKNVTMSNTYYNSDVCNTGASSL
jgi:hypothetical protein